MTDKLYDEARRGEYAAELLNNPVFQDVWSQFETQIMRELKASSPRDADGREKCILMLQILEKLRKMIEDTAYSGKMANMMIERKSAAQKVREWITRDGLVESRS